MLKISRSEPGNSANWPVEFEKICYGKLWSLLMRNTYEHDWLTVLLACCVQKLLCLHKQMWQFTVFLVIVMKYTVLCA